MNPDSASSASTSGTTSASARQKPRGPASESDFLARQAEEAKAALGRAVGELTQHLGKGVDPRRMTKQHPWMMVAGAAAAGFAGAYLLVPSKEEQALKRLAAIEKALMPKPAPAASADAAHGQEDGGAKAYSKGHTGFLGGLGRQVLEAVKPAIMSALTAGITAKAAQPDAQQYQASPPPDPNLGGNAGGAQYQPPPEPSAAI